MSDGSQLKPFEPDRFFSDGQSSRPAVPGTVPYSIEPRSRLDLSGMSTEQIEELNELPVALTIDLLARGQRQFDIFCALCHGRDGYGQGIIVRHGFTPPPSLHTDHLRGHKLGHFYNVISNGFGAMYSYADRIEPADRWAIIAYIRTLQLSQYAPPDIAPSHSHATPEAPNE